MPAPLTPEVLTVGLTYRDLIFTGVDALPAPGEERYATGFGEMWGGIATMARVCATPSDVAAKLQHAEVSAPAIIVDLRDPAAPWLIRARQAGSTVFASRGFDATGEWGDDALRGLSGTDVWLLNDLEATAFTGLSDPLDAARALAARVPLVVVTRGAAGMVAVDAATGKEAHTPAFPVTPVGTTGAGDATLAAFAFAHSLPDASLTERLSLAAFIASAVLASPGGAATPPTRAQLVRLATEGSDERLGRIRELLA